MQTAGLTMNDAWAHRVRRVHGVTTYETSQEEATLVVLVDSLELKHHGVEEKHRPYLHVVGELTSVRFEKPLAFNLDEITYSQGQRDTVHAFYEFTEDQLAVLVKKGLYSRAFDVPSQTIGLPWELPGVVDALVVAPDLQSDDPAAREPIAFLRAHNLGNVEITLDNSGYDLAEYFADRSAELSAEVEAPQSDRVARVRQDEIHSLFTDADYVLEGETAREAQRAGIAEHDAQQEAAASPGTSVDEGLAAIRAQLEADQEAQRRELEQKEGTPENLYHSRVASEVSRSVSNPAIDTSAPVEQEKLTEAEKAVTAAQQAQEARAAREAQRARMQAEREAAERASNPLVVTPKPETPGLITFDDEDLTRSYGD